MAAGRGAKGRGSRSARSLTLDDLPSMDTRRWVARRKALVVKGIDAGLISASEACARYCLSDEELRAWQHRFGHSGLPRLPGRERRER